MHATAFSPWNDRWCAEAASALSSTLLGCEPKANQTSDRRGLLLPIPPHGSRCGLNAIPAVVARRLVGSERNANPNVARCDGPPSRAEHTDAVAESSGTCVSSSLCGVGAWASNCWAHMGVLPKRYCMEMDVPAAQASASARTEATGRRRTRAGCDSRWCGWSERHRETASKYLAFSSYASSVGTPSSASHDVQQSRSGHRWLSKA